ESFAGGAAGRLADEGKTLVFVRDGRGIAGLIALKDELRPEAAEAVRRLREAGIRTVMLTGDRKQTAAAIAGESGIDEFAAECLPEGKVRELQSLRRRFKSVAMVGDGINDAPALATATVGIAMGGGTDAALEVADVVLMKNDLVKIADAIRLAKRMNRIIRQNIAFSVAVILLLIAANFAQSLALPAGVIGHEGSTLLVILNGLRLLKSCPVRQAALGGPRRASGIAGPANAKNHHARGSRMVVFSCKDFAVWHQSVPPAGAS